MRKTSLFVMVVTACLLMRAGMGVAAHGNDRPEKKAILIVAFGTSVPEAQKAFDHIDARVREMFPETETRWAYTSRIIRAKLARTGKVLDSPEVALAKLMEERYTHVAILSLHTIPGREFHDLYQNSKLFSQMTDGLEKIVIARPLLSSREDMVRVAKALLGNVPGDRKPEDAVLLMGHGSEHHPADAVYGAMNQVFSELDPNVYVGTVEGYPLLEDLLPRLRKKGTRKVYLMPFMSVAGDHARNDMAGDDPDSWKSILVKEGYEVEVLLKGTAEYPEVVDVWLDHLHDLYSQL